MNTPYQGDKRVYGYFQCSSCRRKWESGNSWANKGQECKRCDVIVYPYSQKPLKKVEEDSKIDQTKEHPMELCEMCKELGYSC
ncbi:zinc finger CCHC domain-containing protein [Acrasis kona]|uniref:Zinc finger CCHC domain-containing protein n=1 Tax=Acrasis kona TaxID=1008807 RepID=A0AAW2ZSY8_9EUKA